MPFGGGKDKIRVLMRCGPTGTTAVRSTTQLIAAAVYRGTHCGRYFFRQWVCLCVLSALIDALLNANQSTFFGIICRRIRRGIAEMKIRLFHRFIFSTYGVQQQFDPSVDERKGRPNPVREKK